MSLVWFSEHLQYGNYFSYSLANYLSSRRGGGRVEAASQMCCCCSSLSPAPVLRQITASLKAPCGICLVNKQVMFTFKMHSLLMKRWNTIFLKSLKAALVTSILTCFFAHQWTTVTLFLGMHFRIPFFPTFSTYCSFPSKYVLLHVESI